MKYTIIILYIYNFPYEKFSVYKKYSDSVYLCCYIYYFSVNDLYGISLKETKQNVTKRLILLTISLQRIL